MALLRSVIHLLRCTHAAYKQRDFLFDFIRLKVVANDIGTRKQQPLKLVKLYVTYEVAW
jgi:hypothetical protein